MGSAVALVRAVVGLAGTLTHHTVTDNQAWTILLGLSLLDGLTDLVDIVTVDLLDIPAPCLVLLGGVLASNHLCAGRELNIIGVVEHDQVVETEVTGDTASALRDLLLYTTVRDIGVDGLVHHVAQTSLQELGGDGGTNGEAMTLTERTRGVLDAACNLTLGVTGSH